MGFRHSSKTYRLLTLEKNLIKLLSVCKLVTVSYSASGRIKWHNVYKAEVLMYGNFFLPQLLNEIKKEATKGVFFLDSQMSLLVYPYSNTFNMAVMQFWKERNYFGVLGEQSFIVKKINNCFFMPRGFLRNRMIVSDLILCWNLSRGWDAYEIKSKIFTFLSSLKMLLWNINMKKSAILGELCPVSEEPEQKVIGCRS